MAKDTRDWGSYANDPKTTARIKTYFAKAPFRQARAKLENRTYEQDREFLEQVTNCRTTREKAELLLRLNYVTNPRFSDQEDSIINNAFESQLAIVRKRHKTA